jgi:ssDNA-binding Zn-finger/Zn-ribbon topoisomerase 1
MYFDLAFQELLPLCPYCGGKMTVREGPRNAFLGCIHYPECAGTRSTYRLRRAIREYEKRTKQEPDDVCTERGLTHDDDTEHVSRDTSVHTVVGE